MVSHFRNLASHRVPVLRLYRHMLRVASCYDQVGLMKFMFHRRRNDSSSYQARKHLLEAYEWEDILRTSLENDHSDPVIKSRIDTKIAEVKAKIQQVQQRKQQNKNSSNANRNTAHKRDRDRLVNYNTPPKGLELAELRENHRLQTYRNRVVKQMRKQGQLPSKVRLDQSYLDFVLVPEYRNRKLVQRLNQQFQKDQQEPNVKLQTIGTPLGPFSFIRYPDRKPSEEVGTMIRQLVHTDLLDKIQHLEDQLAVAKEEAEWESRVTGCDIKTATAEWCGHIQTALNNLKRQKEHRRRKMALYRRTLIARLHLHRRFYKGRQKRRLKRWRKVPIPTTRMRRYVAS